MNRVSKYDCITYSRHINQKFHKLFLCGGKKNRMKEEQNLDGKKCNLL